MASIESVTLTVGMEIHVELATRSKMFTRVASPARLGAGEPEPNTLIDPVVLALPGALPVLNRRAIELSMKVGLALGCSVAPVTRWDRKSYFYPDLPKAYQISQYDLPVCADGMIDWPIRPEGEHRRIGIIRAHLEEDAGKLLHEWPGGRAIDHSIVDLNRAGTPLLEIVTRPDFTSADEVVAFAQLLRNVCRHLGATEGDMQKGHMRFEPNINTTITTDDGRRHVTPIVEIKNLNSFRSLRAAIEHELDQQPKRWLEDGRVMEPGAKTTRGWDDQKMVSFLQREKEEAHDYRYFPDPDLLPVSIDRAWVDRVRAEMPELPHVAAKRYRDEFGLGEKEAAALVAEPAQTRLFEAALDVASPRGGIPREKAGRQIANLILQSARKLANERGCDVADLGISPAQLAGIARLRLEDQISAAGADQLVGELSASDEQAPDAAQRLGLLQVTDTGQLEEWVDAALSDPANARSIEDVKAGKMAAAGRLIGAVMKASGGQADAKKVRQLILDRLGVG